MDGIVLQQSSLLPLCDGQGIDPQHCIACSGVLIAEQSAAYVMRAAARQSHKIDLPMSILDSG
jgi:hypothetical protein